MKKAEARNVLKNTGYIGNEVGIAFDVAIKSMDKLEKIEQIVNTAKAFRLTLDSQDIQAICEVLEDD